MLVGTNAANWQEEEKARELGKLSKCLAWQAPGNSRLIVNADLNWKEIWLP